MDKFIFNGPGISFGYIDTDDEQAVHNITPQQLGLPANTQLTNQQKIERLQFLMKNQLQQMQAYMNYSENMPETQKNQIKQMMKQMAAQLMDENKPY